MKKSFSLIFISLIIQSIFLSVNAQLTVPPSGGNKKASVSEMIGLTHVIINYDRPGVKKREGHIWGDLIPAGYTDQGFGSSKAAPWRAGANENTTFEVSTDVKIEGQTLPAGKYGFFVAYNPSECTLLFSKNSTSWGSFFYNPSEDVLKVKVKPVKLENSVEWLKYEFTDQTPTSAVVQLQWEKLSIPFKIEVDLVNNQIEVFRKELRNKLGFDYKNWNQAAQYAVDNKVNLQEALLWSDTAIKFGGNKDFRVQSTRAAILKELGKTEESDAVMKSALPNASMQDIHQYGRQLLAQKRYKEAFEVFKMNYTKYPNEFTTNMGMVRSYSALGDYKNALLIAKHAETLAPDKLNKDFVTKAIKLLQEGKDIN